MLGVGRAWRGAVCRGGGRGLLGPPVGGAAAELVSLVRGMAAIRVNAAVIWSAQRAGL